MQRGLGLFQDGILEFTSSDWTLRGRRKTFGQVAPKKPFYYTGHIIHTPTLGIYDHTKHLVWDSPISHIQLDYIVYTSKPIH